MHEVGDFYLTIRIIGMVVLFIGLMIFSALWKVCRRIFSDVAHRYGLRLHAIGAGPLPSLHGDLAGHQAMIRTGFSAGLLPEIRITLKGLPPDLWLEPRGSLLSPSQDQRRVVLGDRLFDDRIWLCGDEAGLRGALSDDARWEIARIITHHKITIGDGELHASLTGLPTQGDKLEALIEAILKLLGHLEGADSPDPIALSARAQHDRNRGLRRRALEILIERWPNHSATQRALAAALEDPAAKVRLAAAEAALSASLPVWSTLCALVESQKAPLDVRQRALAAFERQIPTEINPDPKPSEVIGRLLRQPSPLVEAVALAGRLQSPDLVEAFNPEHRISVLEAWVKALKRAPGEVQPLLLQQLQSAYEEIKLAAIDGLAERGDVHAVAPLQEIAWHARRWGSVKQAATDAALIIQRRLGDDAVQAAGGLSLHEFSDLNGGLSEAEGGQLSPAPEPVGPSPEPARAAQDSARPTPLKDPA